MTDLATFIGRFHPVLVHLPIGLIVLLALFELISRWPRFSHASQSAGLILGLAVPFSIAAAACGWLLSTSGGYDPNLLKWHKWTGVGTASACLVAALLHLFGSRQLYRLFLFITVAVLAISSHFGGSLTHGRGYLSQYAPPPLRALLGARDRAITRTAGPEAKPAGNLDRPVFAKLVQPLLRDNCVPCHGPEKSKGSLRLDSYEALLKGGENGPAIVAGKSGDSLMVQRVLLPLDNDEHMPPDGKPQPKPEDITLLRWWIDSGASVGATSAQLKPPADVLQIVRSRLGGGAATGEQPNLSAGSGPRAVAPKPAPEIRPNVEKLADDLGIAIGFLGENEPWLQCNASPAGRNFTETEMARLEPLAQHIRWLDVSGTGITDAGFAHMAAMTNLTRLHAERTAISDAALKWLTGLKNLEYLNLYGTGVSDAGLKHLEALPKLRNLFLWQTRVTPAAAKQFAAERIDKDQIQKWEEEIDLLKAKISSRQVTIQLGLQ